MRFAVRTLAPPKRDWTLTQEAFERLLVSLDADRERAGQRYEGVRRKLIEFFEARGAESPAEGADETINRVARRLSEGAEVQDLQKYFYGVARLVLLERFRAQERETVPLASVTPAAETAADDQERAERLAGHEARLECLEACLQGLPAESREFIVEYYRAERGEKIARRKEQARRLGIPLGALRLRAYRLRTRLEDCVRSCLAGRPPRPTTKPK